MVSHRSIHILSPNPPTVGVTVVLHHRAFGVQGSTLPSVVNFLRTSTC